MIPPGANGLAPVCVFQERVCCEHNPAILKGVGSFSAPLGMALFRRGKSLIGDACSATAFDRCDVVTALSLFGVAEVRSHEATVVAERGEALAFGINLDVNRFL